jgi:hypothetical protein
VIKTHENKRKAKYFFLLIEDTENVNSAAPFNKTVKQIIQWLHETLIFIKISPQSVYGKYFKIKKFFFANITFVDPVNVVGQVVLENFQSKIQVGVCIALRDRLQLIGTYFYSIWRVIAYF